MLAQLAKNSKVTDEALVLAGLVLASLRLVLLRSSVDKTLSADQISLRCSVHTYYMTVGSSTHVDNVTQHGHDRRAQDSQRKVEATRVGQQARHEVGAAVGREPMQQPEVDDELREDCESAEPGQHHLRNNGSRSLLRECCHYSEASTQTGQVGVPALT